MTKKWEQEREDTDMGKGMQPEKGRDLDKFRDAYDSIDWGKPKVVSCYNTPIDSVSSEPIEESENKSLTTNE